MHIFSSSRLFHSPLEPSPRPFNSSNTPQPALLRLYQHVGKQATSPLAKVFDTGTVFASMCTTNQVVFKCSHRATHRYRTNVCQTANRRECWIWDQTSVFPFPCRDCVVPDRQKRRRCGGGGCNESSQQEGRLPDRLLDEMWHVPSRCFVDVGFKTLDPFGVGNDRKNVDGTAVQSQRAELSPFGTHVELVASGSPVQTDQIGSWKCARGIEEWRLSSCCLQETRNGAYQATRLEDRGDRPRGIIADSFCGSRV